MDTKIKEILGYLPLLLILFLIIFIRKIDLIVGLIILILDLWLSFYAIRSIPKRRFSPSPYVVFDYKKRPIIYIVFSIVLAISLILGLFLGIKLIIG